MLDTKALIRATLIGTVLQIAMVVAGHFIPYIAQHLFMFGGLGLSLIAGLLYGRDHGAWGGALLGGAVAGAVCALIGIAVSVLLADTPANILLLGTIGSAVAGVVGGAIGKLSAAVRIAAAPALSRQTCRSSQCSGGRRT